MHWVTNSLYIHVQKKTIQYFCTIFWYLRIFSAKYKELLFALGCKAGNTKCFISCLCLNFDLELDPSIDKVGMKD